nr:glycosyltransferase [Natronobacillus azotifigens]
MAVWHANLRTKEDAKESLRFLAKSKEVLKSSDFKRSITILEVENYRVLNLKGQAEEVLKSRLAKDQHFDLVLAASTLEDNIEKRLEWINRIYEKLDLENISLKSKNSVPYNNLNVKANPSTTLMTDQHKVTVIIPAYNAEDTIKTTLESVINQTWSNLEIIVVDDCSTDNTPNLIKAYQDKDSRLKFLSTEVNSGAYVARNMALQLATGEFVTINDADDWSHCRKIEIQVSHLINNHKCIANTSQQARITEELLLDRRANHSGYIFKNISSLMFRRKQALEAIGYWDSVRFMADGEFIRRLKRFFGKDSIIDLKTGPLSFQRQTNNSLTNNSAFGYNGYLTGARKEYFDSYLFYHQNCNNLKYDFPLRKRPFPVPYPMLPSRSKEDRRKSFDVILVSDFRLAGGSNMSNVEEIVAQKKMGLRIGLCQMYRYDFDPRRSINKSIRDLIDGDQVQMIVYGERVECDLMILRYPPILQEKQKYIPDVKSHRIHVIINQPPKSDYGPNAVLRYNMIRANKHLKEYFNKEATWFPIGPLVRNVLHEHHANELEGIKLSEKDWSNIIDINEWKRSSRPKKNADDKIIIGRHSRDHEVKWPVDRKEMLDIYPESERYEVRVLGGAETPKSVIGRIPDNWSVTDFGQVHPKEFLKELDVFIYYTHPQWVEAFGRVIIEAMSVGIPTILPYQYEELFHESAIYAEPHEVQKKITELMNDEDYYESQVNKAFRYVDENFGYLMHAKRLQYYGSVNVENYINSSIQQFSKTE